MISKPRYHRRAARCAILAIFVFVLFHRADSSYGGTGFRLVLPAWPVNANTAVPLGMTTRTTTGGVVGVGLSAPTTPAAGNKTGLVLSLDTTWAEGNGYRPVRITITPTAPTQADRSLRVSFRPGNAAVAVTRDIELPAGFTSVTTTLSVPQLGPWYSVAFDVFEDGEHVRELSIPQNSMGIGTSQFSGDNASPTLLILNTSANSNTILNAMGRAGQPVLQVGQSNSISTSTTILAGNPRRQLIVNLGDTIPSMADLPERWIDYSMLDVIVASRQDLQTLVEQHPAQWRAIRRWIRAGGNLWVYGVGEFKSPQGQSSQQWRQWNLASDKPWAHLDAINKSIEFPPTADKSRCWPEVPALSGWNAGDPTAPMVYSVGDTVAADAARALAAESAIVWTDARFPFALRRLGQGMVVAIPGGDTVNDSQFDWQAVFNNVNWHWPTRHGVNFTGQNDNYWSFLIPGVGAAPVTAFQVLITLFVLAIGPLNFYLLRRWQKLNLLLVTVPVCAAVITVALLLYAVFADGFGIQVRTRSFTELNQQTGEATCLGRITYYAGLTPSKGLTFSGDVTVYPLSESPITTQFDSAGTRRLAWSFEDENDAVGTQQLESGWLQSRIQTQLVTVRSRKTGARLNITSRGDRASSVANELGAHISILLVRDAAGNYAVARDLAADAEQSLDPIDSNVIEELSAIEGDSALDLPEGVQIGGSDSIFGITRRYYGRRTTYNTASIITLPEGSMLERSLSETLRAAIEQGLPPRSYVAIVDRSPEFELGVESATDESSLHVILGRW